MTPKTMLYAALLLGALPVTGSPFEISENPRPDESRGVVLTGETALTVEKRICPSSKPGQSSTLWQPGPAEIARLEKLLPAFMSRQETPRDYKLLPEYYRQYVGVVRGGKKSICVNFFHESFVQSMRSVPLFDPVTKKPTLKRSEDFWKHDPIIVFDGGAYFFNVQFDVEAGSFHSLRFNGDA